MICVCFCSCIQEGDILKGVQNLPEDAFVRFVSQDGYEITLSPKAGLRVIETLRSDSTFMDGRGLALDETGQFIIDDQKYYLFIGFICEDLRLKGRQWKSDWIESAFREWRSDGLPNNKQEWKTSLESILTDVTSEETSTLE